MGSLPLLDGNNTACFDKESKANILRETFFTGAHLKDTHFDEKFKEEVERDVKKMKNGMPIKCDWCKDMKFLNGDISLDEVQAVLQMQKVGIGPRR